MSSQITGPPTPPTMGDQLAAFQALAELAQMFGHLPIPYVTVQVVPSVGFDLQLDSPSAFEQWRAALQIAPDAVKLHDYQQNSWLSADAIFRGVRLEVSGHGLLLTAAETQAEQDAVTA